ANACYPGKNGGCVAPAPALLLPARAILLRLPSRARPSLSPAAPLPPRKFPPWICRRAFLDRSRRGAAAAVVAMFQPPRPLGAPTAEIRLVGSGPSRRQQLPVGIEEAGARLWAISSQVGELDYLVGAVSSPKHGITFAWNLCNVSVF
ncbi:unnamed protein product, partial [Urochloa humidicola]